MIGPGGFGAAPKQADPVAVEACCPHCGGKNGYTYRLFSEYIMQGGWGERAEAGSNPDGSNSLASCDDCGRKMRVSSAENVKPAALALKSADGAGVGKCE